MAEPLNEPEDVLIPAPDRNVCAFDAKRSIQSIRPRLAGTVQSATVAGIQLP